MTKGERDILIRVYTQQMEDATRQHAQISGHITAADLDEITLTRRRACVKTVERMKALIEQLREQEVYRKIKTGSTVSTGKVNVPTAGRVADRTLHINPKDKFFRDKIPEAVLK